MKKWYQSKTIWTNLIATLITVITLLQDQSTLSSLGIHNVQKFLSILGLLTGVLNLLLRLFSTSVPITPTNPITQS